MATDEGDPQPEQREVLIAEAELMEARHQAWANAQTLQAAWWRRWDTVIKTSASVLAAAAGGAGLASAMFRSAAGVAALAAAVLSAMGGAFGSSARTEEYFGAATVNQTLADQARDFRTTIAPFAPMDQVQQRYAELCEKRDGVVSNAPLRLGVRAVRLFRGHRAPTGIDKALGNQPRAGA